MIAVFGSYFAHERPFGRIAVPAAAEDSQHLALRKLRNSLQHILQTVRRMRIVNDYREILTGIH